MSGFDPSAGPAEIIAVWKREEQRTAAELSRRLAAFNPSGARLLGDWVPVFDYTARCAEYWIEARKGRPDAAGGGFGGFGGIGGFGGQGGFGGYGFIAIPEPHGRTLVEAARAQTEAFAVHLERLADGARVSGRTEEADALAQAAAAARARLEEFAELARQGGQAGQIGHEGLSGHWGQGGLSELAGQSGQAWQTRNAGPEPGVWPGHGQARSDQPDGRTGHDQARSDQPDVWAGHGQASRDLSDEQAGHGQARSDQPDERTGHDQARSDQPDGRTDHVDAGRGHADRNRPDSRPYRPVPIGGHTLPPLPYAYDALEPYIDEATMRIHHDRHHRAYVDGLNRAELALQAARASGQFDLVKHWERELAFNGAGHYLHTIFWNVMSPRGGGRPTGALAEAIDASFGSFEAFQRQFSAAAEQVEGGGWAILVWSPRSGRLEILQAEKHQNLSQWDVVPLLPLDVWEHAYYLKHQNRRADYIRDWWNVVNWPYVGERFAKASQLRWEPY